MSKSTVLAWSRYSAGITPLAFGGTFRIRLAPWPYFTANCSNSAAEVMNGIPLFQNQLAVTNEKSDSDTTNVLLLWLVN